MMQTKFLMLDLKLTNSKLLHPKLVWYTEFVTCLEIVQIVVYKFYLSVSPYACDLLIGLLNKDHRKRYDLKEICAHHWVQHGSEAPILETPKSNGTA